MVDNPSPDLGAGNGLLAGRTLVVTGAQQGIGRAVASAASRSGARVVANVLDPDAGPGLVAELEANGGPATAIAADVSTRSGCEEIIAAADKFGGADLLVNNAGVFPRSPLLELTDDEWDHVQNVNLKSVFRLTQLFARSLADRPGESSTGSIVSLASIAAYRPSPRGAHYAASKAGIVGFTHTAAAELGPHGIRINAVAPGLVDTAQPRDGMTEAEIAAASAAVPIGQMATPADIADVVVFLLSDAARHITGQTVHVNGGQYTV